MNLKKDEKGQGSAEYLLLVGGVIVVAIIALVVYQSYFRPTSISYDQDIEIIRNGSEGSATPPDNGSPPDDSNPPSMP
ncbi:hypothetical protein JCM15415_17870 [Methanobacterium movens]